MSEKTETGFEKAKRIADGIRATVGQGYKPMDVDSTHKEAGENMVKPERMPWETDEELKERREAETKDSAPEVALAPRLEHHGELAKPSYYPIAGLDEVPTSVVPLPFCRLVQGQTRNITVAATGQDAPVGTFYMADTGEAFNELYFFLIRAKHIRKLGKKWGTEEMEWKTNIGLVGIRVEGMAPFMISLPVTSFSNFGQMMSQLKRRGATRAWEYAITMGSEKGENEKGKFAVATFKLDDNKQDESSLKFLDDAFSEFGGSLDRWTPEE